MPARLALWLLISVLVLPAVARAGLARLTQALRRETSGLATLESISERIVHLREDLEQSEFHSKQLSQQIAEAERRRASLEERLAARQRHVQLRVRGLYKMSRGGLIRLLVESPDEERASARLSAATLILRRDVGEIAAFSTELQRLRSEQQKLEAARQDQARVAKKLAHQRAELDEAHQQQMATLHRLRYSRRLQQALAGELDSQQRALLNRISELRWRVRIAGGFAALKGRLPRPVGGPVTSIFGNHVDGAAGISVLRRGLTFRPSPHEAVHAVADGLVRVAGPLEGYGRLVVIEHSDGYFSLYGFLASTSVREGERVRRTTPIGRAGVDPLTGRIAAYFELRHGERPLDPADWIVGERKSSR